MDGASSGPGAGGNSWQILMDRIVAGLMAYHPEKVILFGSMARGDADEYSDVDLIVVKETQERFVRRLVEVMKFLPGDVPIDALVYTPEELKAMQDEGNPFIEHALKDAVVLYEKPSGDG